MDPDSAQALPGVDAHPHARAVLLPALPPAGVPSHAYLFHGPSGTGKRTVARAFATALLADGARAREAVAGRVARGAHPDLAWVSPSGAGEMLVGDIDQAVVAAAARTPFESLRRVFVLEDAHTLNDQAANRLLKTLEEPPPFVHLILLAPSPREVLPTIASRCQQVRFDPLPLVRIEERLVAEVRGPGDWVGDAPELQSLEHPVNEHREEEGARADWVGDAQELQSAEHPEIEHRQEGARDSDTRGTPAQLAACARLALGDARLARELAGAQGVVLRERAEGFVGSALHGDDARGAGGYLDKLLQAARDVGAAAGEALAARVAGELELLPRKERKRHEREAADAQRRAERRTRTGALDLALRLAQLWLRDLWCVAEGADELVHAVDRRPELERDAAGRTAASLREGVELVQETRLRLPLNVSEELALEALAYRLRALFARPAPRV